MRSTDLKPIMVELEQTEAIIESSMSKLVYVHTLTQFKAPRPSWLKFKGKI